MENGVKGHGVPVLSPCLPPNPSSLRELIDSGLELLQVNSLSHTALVSTVPAKSSQLPTPSSPSGILTQSQTGVCAGIPGDSEAADLLARSGQTLLTREPRLRPLVATSQNCSNEPPDGLESGVSGELIFLLRISVEEGTLPTTLFDVKHVSSSVTHHSTE
ncbi:hypothetical protein P7K49_027915 [Saguinus oedipus]|uniref:Uncharacterized protein n=1 Tax=Saguinus oedipus TaxID=9490 RepID=A0ABQ9UD17_SAGOE|nr:hypothetical protein P7K49_027915 [Saguinus oedipus]